MDDDDGRLLGTLLAGHGLRSVSVLCGRSTAHACVALRDLCGTCATCAAARAEAATLYAAAGGPHHTPNVGRRPPPAVARYSSPSAPRPSTFPGFGRPQGSPARSLRQARQRVTVCTRRSVDADHSGPEPARHCCSGDPSSTEASVMCGGLRSGFIRLTRNSTNAIAPTRSCGTCRCLAGWPSTTTVVRKLFCTSPVSHRSCPPSWLSEVSGWEDRQGPP